MDHDPLIQDVLALLTKAQAEVEGRLRARASPERVEAGTRTASLPDAAGVPPIPTLEERLFAIEMRLCFLEQGQDECCQLLTRALRTPATGGDAHVT